MAEPKTRRLKQIQLAFAASAFAANGWLALALAFAAVAAFAAANGCLALASVAFAAFVAFAANGDGWLALAAWAWAQDEAWARAMWRCRRW